MTGKQHVIEKTMIIIIIQQKRFSMFLLQDPSSELAKWRGSENWKYYYFLNSLHCCRHKALEKSISSMLVYICGQEDSILLTNFLACHEEEKQNKEEKMRKLFQKHSYKCKNIHKKREACSCITVVPWFKRQ